MSQKNAGNHGETEKSISEDNTQIKMVEILQTGRSKSSLNLCLPMAFVQNGYYHKKTTLARNRL
jgi:hypothetical protein